LCYNSKVIQRESAGTDPPFWARRSRPGSRSPAARRRKPKPGRSCENWDENLKARNFEEAEKTADSILMMIGASE